MRLNSSSIHQPYLYQRTLNTLCSYHYHYYQQQQQPPASVVIRMAASTLHAEVELKSVAEKFWESMRDSTILFPKVFPFLYKSIEVLEGDGKCPGSIRLITYGEGSPLVKVSTEKIDTVDEGKKEVSYSVIEGDLLKYYKNFNGTISVAPKGEGSLVKWSCVFEKTSDEVPDPHIIKDFAIENFKDLDVFLLNLKA